MPTATDLRRLLNMRDARERLRTDEVAARFRFPSAEAARKWLHRHDVPNEARGRVLLYDPRDIEAAFERLRHERVQRQAS